MATLTMIKTIKEIHKEDIVLVRVGDFYHVYGRDSYIISFLMGYKLKMIEDNCWTCGFPLKALPKIEATLEEKKINYIIVDRRNNYDVEEYSNNKNLNTYSKYFKRAQEYINKKKRIDNIYVFLLKNIEKQEINNKVKQIEEIIKK